MRKNATVSRNGWSQLKALFLSKWGKSKKLKGKRGKFFDRWLIQAYLHYLSLQVGWKKIGKTKEYDYHAYSFANRYLIWLWSIIGSSGYIFFLMVTSIAAKPELFFIYSPIFANIWLVIIWLVQIRTNRKLTDQNQG